MFKRISATLILAGAVLSSEAAITTNTLRMTLDVPSTYRLSNFEDEDAISAGPVFAGSLLSLNFAGGARLQLDALLVRTNLIIFSTDVDFVLNSVNYADEDLIAYNYVSGNYSMYLDGSAVGVPASADLDAACFIPGTTNLLLSFDTSATLPGISGPIDDDDIIRFQSGFTKQYDGVTNLGLTAGMDIDGLHLTGNSLYYSLDTSFRRAALTGTDKDLWIFATNTLLTTLLTGFGLPAGADLCDFDDPVDTDGDGLTDLEEITGVDEAGTTVGGTSYAMSPSPYRPNPNLADSDGDKVNDSDEAVAGTNPTNSLDFLRLTGITKGPNEVVTWASVTNRLYDIEVVTNIVDGFAGTLTADNVTSGGSSTAITNGLIADMIFFRVRVQPQ